MDELRAMIEDLFTRFGDSNDPRWKLPEARKIIAQISLRQLRDAKDGFDKQERRAKERYGSYGKGFKETRAAMFRHVQEAEKRLQDIEDSND